MCGRFMTSIKEGLQGNASAATFFGTIIIAIYLIQPALFLPSSTPCVSHAPSVVHGLFADAPPVC